MTVMFIRLLLDLENPDYGTVEQTHAALLAIQNAIYARKGTLRQFLQVSVHVNIGPVCGRSALGELALSCRDTSSRRTYHRLN